MVRTVLLLFFVGFALIAAAQTTTDFTARYGDPDVERFVVRPGIALTVEYGSDTTACQMVIEPMHSIVRRDTAVKYMRPEVVTQILDEVLPESDRGTQLRRLVTKSGCNAFEITDYENAIIVRTTHTCDLPNPEIAGEATIARKGLSCRAIEK
jgi:hypothetical protein